MSGRFVYLTACWAAAALLTGACASGGSVSAPPLKVPVAGAPNGIEIRESDGAVFVTDDKTNGILQTHDIADAAPAFSLFARVPVAEGERTSLS